MAEPQALFDQALGDAEARGDGGHGKRRPGRVCGERDHLVRGVHGDADDVLGERQLTAIAITGNQTWLGVVLIQNALAGEGFHGCETAAAGDGRVAADGSLPRT